MKEAQLFFLSDDYFRDFPDDRLMKNKYNDDGTLRSRPCFFAFADRRHHEIYWIVPISSQVEKYERIAHQKVKRNGVCDTIRFGEVLGRKTAFLIQNMCPATAQYLTPYIGRNHIPVPVSDKIADDVKRHARNALAVERQRRNNRIIFPDIFKIYSELEGQLTPGEN